MYVLLVRSHLFMSKPHQHNTRISFQTHTLIFLHFPTLYVGVSQISIFSRYVIIKTSLFLLLKNHLLWQAVCPDVKMKPHIIFSKESKSTCINYGSDHSSFSSWNSSSIVLQILLLLMSCRFFLCLTCTVEFEQIIWVSIIWRMPIKGLLKWKVSVNLTCLLFCWLRKLK